MFVLTEELKAQLITFNEQVKHPAQLNTDAMAEQPFNPWISLVEQMVASVSHISIGWSTHDEICVDFLERAYSGDLFDHLRGRYQVRAMDAQDMIDVLKQFTVLQQY